MLAEVVSVLEDQFPVRVQRAPALPLNGAAWDAQRRQYAAPAILQQVLQATPPEAQKHLALTSADLFIPMLTFVYGQAQLGGAAALVSLARLRQEFYSLPPDPRLSRLRARKEAVHETGHLFGLVHCQEPECAMRLSTNLSQLDRKSDALCPACARRVLEVSR
jgi:Predicted Zn-dependent proteases